MQNQWFSTFVCWRPTKQYKYNLETHVNLLIWMNKSYYYYYYYLAMQRRVLATQSNQSQPISSLMHKSNLMAGQKNSISEDPNDMFLPIIEGGFIKKSSKRYNISGMVGRIKSFRGPHLAYLVHVCICGWRAACWETLNCKWVNKLASYVLCSMQGSSHCLFKMPDCSSLAGRTSVKTK